jgi:hypothetical protein
MAYLLHNTSRCIRNHPETIPKSLPDNWATRRTALRHNSIHLPTSSFTPKIHVSPQPAHLTYNPPRHLTTKDTTCKNDIILRSFLRLRRDKIITQDNFFYVASISIVTKKHQNLNTHVYVPNSQDALTLKSLLYIHFHSLPTHDPNTISTFMHFTESRY